MRMFWMVATVLALAATAAAEPQNNCGDSRLAKRRHLPLVLLSQEPGVKVRIQWKMKIGGHEECGTVELPWKGSLPEGSYNLIVYVDGKVVAQRGVGLGGTTKPKVVDVTPAKP